MNPIVKEIKKLQAIAHEIYLSEKYPIDYAAATMLYMIPGIILTKLEIWLGLSPVVVVATIFVSVACAVIVPFTMPRNGTFAQRITHRKKLVLKLVSY